MVLQIKKNQSYVYNKNIQIIPHTFTSKAKNSARKNSREMRIEINCSR
jgi:hypothetical protein